MPYGQWWRRHRRAFWQHFRPDAVLGYQQAQCQIARRFLRALLQDPSELVEHIQYTALGSLMKVIYDIDVVRETDFRTYSSVLHSVQEGVGEVFQPGSSLIEYFPVLRWLPSFLPGGSYVRRASKWRSSAYHLREEPFVRAQKTFQSVSSVAFLHRLLKRVAASASESAALVSEETEIAENVAAVSLSGTLPFTYSLLQAFFLAMSQHPDVVKKAQEELDSVVGNNRLPDFGDQDKLVYLTAIVKETLRWHVVVPFGVPHCTTRDDELRGYYVPANTVLLPNIWACLHDPEAYQDPEDFRPERFIRDGKLDPSVRDPSAFAFGFGRRRVVCPGRHFAEAALFINIASVLHVFDIGPPLDGAGKPIKIQYKMTNGFLSYASTSESYVGMANSPRYDRYPEDCRCSIVPRSAQAERLIREAQ
ncbi:cytochrome P450 [Dichomitus squalens]|uniref:Cytochrome P450 n=1 Tax=Dichomitus squalens TaxID=114155 RepID=A0A4V6MWY0_9APHY|nr:cytochrome P450 [Dichomitus squalens]